MKLQPSKRRGYKIGAITLCLTLIISMIFSQPAQATISFRAAGNGNNAGGALTLVINAPAGVQAGDVMIAVMSIAGGTGTTINSVPTGWNVINSANSTTVLKSATYYKVAAAGEPSSYSFGLSASVKAAGVISAYSGADISASPIDASNVAAYAQSLTLTSPTVSTTVANTMVIAAFSTAISATLTAGSSMTLDANARATSGGTGNAGTKRTAGQQYILQPAIGATGTKNMTASAQAVNIGHTIALKPESTVSQVGFRFFANNTTSGVVGTALAAQDASVSTTSSQPIRLRMLLGASGAQLTAGKSFKLQYKAIASGACDATGAFADVGATTPIQWYDNTSTTDSYSPLTTSGNDPFRSGVTVVPQTYKESNPFAVSTAVPVGQDGMWDFSLVMSGAADIDSTYCLRAIWSNGTALAAYSQVPSLTLVPSANRLDQSNFRLYQNADSATPGTPLSDISGAATLGATGSSFRIRTGVSGHTEFKQMSGGGYTTCGIASDNKAYCWGRDFSGQLGDNASLTSQPTPVAVDTSGVLSGKTILSISVGFSHTCAIASDNKAYCWGLDTNGQLGDNASLTQQPTPVAVDTSGVLSGKTILAISAGSSYTCVIASDNKAYCWGADTGGQLGDNASLTQQPTPVAVDTSGVLSGKTILAISAGSFHTCVLASDNNAYCWGDDSSGQLGDSVSVTQQPTPVALYMTGVLSGKTILAISSGGSHTCAIASDNKAYCWGQDATFGQLGDGLTFVNMPTPVAVYTSGVLSGKTILSISAGTSHTCAIASDNKAYCWGDDNEGQVGDNGTYAHRPVPSVVDATGVLSDKTILAINAGGYASCAIASDGAAYCWGSDAAHGELGNDAIFADQPTPVAVDMSIATTIQIAAGGSHACEVGSDSKAYCWGKDSNSGQLGNDAGLVDQPTPVAVDATGVLAGKTIVSMAGGSDHTCAIASDGKGYCWGSDIGGQLGDNAAIADQSTPVAVDMTGVLAGKTLLSIAAGVYHTCAIASDNKAYCWGFDGNGQLGDDTSTTQQNTPVAVDMTGVLSGKTILSITAGGNQTCVIASDNKAYCWGIDSNGQLGDDASQTQQPTPVAVDMTGVLSGKTIRSIATATSHTCVIASDNKAYCWGADNGGQLGDDATIADQPTPVAVDTSGILSSKTILSIGGGVYHTCVSASDGKAYCWGFDGSGQLGDGASLTQQNTPVAVDATGVLSGKTILSVSVGGYYACAVATDNRPYCWGSDGNGQMGNNVTLADQPTPAAVDVTGVLSPKRIQGYRTLTANRLSLSLQFAQKTAVSCSVQTGFASVTGSTVIAFNDNAAPSNGASIISTANDPIYPGLSTPQTYHDATGTITNPSIISGLSTGLWDFSLKDNGALANTTYCLRLAGNDGTAFNSYAAYPEVTTAAASGGGPTLDQQLRGGTSVINGAKGNLVW